MNKLPNEILSKIFNFLPDENLFNLLEIDSCWRNIINSTIGFEVSIGVDSVFTKLGVQWCEPEIIEEIGVRSCYVGKFLGYRALPFAYPEVLRYLSFEGSISQFNFNTLVAPLTALNHLSIHFAALCRIKIYPSTFYSRVLRILIIHSHQADTVYGQTNAVNFLKNCSTLLNSIVSLHLEKLILDLPFVPHLEERIFHSITSCVSRHNRTLQILQLHWAISFSSIKKAFNKFKSKIDWRVYEGANIKRICFGACQSMQFYEEWKSFICNQKNLQEFFFLNDHLGAFNLSSIRNNTSTLTKVLIHVTVLKDGANLKYFDCEVFKDCSSLTHLLLRGRSFIREQVFNGFNILYPRIINAHFIPKTVQVLSFRQVNVKKTDVAIISSHLPKLRKLRLIHSGTINEFGITPTSLWEIFEQRIIHEIEIIQSFNRATFSTLQGLCFTAQATLTEVWRTGYCNIQLQGDKYYEKTHSMFVYPTDGTSIRANDICDVVFQ